MNFKFFQIGSANQACRWRTPDDNDDSYYSVEGTGTFWIGRQDRCELACAVNTECNGYEFNAVTGKCEIWNRMPLATQDSTTGYGCYQKVPDLVKTVCLNCNQTSFAISGVCSTCADGTLANPEQTGCDSCREGFAGTGGTCELCTPGKFVNGDHTLCLDCAPGKFSSDGTTCEYCSAAGKYTPIAGISCVPCPAGTYSNMDHSGCLTCPESTYGALGVCYTCPDGLLPDSDHINCESCPSTHYGTQGRCYACEDGKYANSDLTDCLDCPYGFAGRGGYCGKCIAGSKPNFLFRATDCETCAFGQYGHDGNKCQYCSTGYRPNPTRTACSGCLEGWYSYDIMNITVGGVYCKRCSPGKEPNERLFANGCDDCVSNEISPGNGSFCESCGNGLRPAAVTSTHAAQTRCELCPIGWAGERGICAQCPPGQKPDILQVPFPCGPHFSCGALLLNPTVHG